MTLRFPGSGVRHGEVRNSVRVGNGRTRFGLVLHPRPRQALIPVEQNDVLASAGFQAAVRERAAVASAGARAAARRFVRRALRPRGASETPEIIDYFNSSGERIRAIIDGTGNARGAPVVFGRLGPDRR